MDAVLGAAILSNATIPPSGSWSPLGLGSCVDDAGAAMPNCYRANLASEAECAAAAANDASSVAYDYYIPCTGAATMCRVRTLGGTIACAAGFSYQLGSATTVTASTGSSLTVCVARVK